MIESKLGRLARLGLMAASTGALTMIALVTACFSDHQRFARWWLVAAVALAGAALAWRLAGRAVLTAWRRLKAPKWT
ncbi:MAG: hypothetical protein LBU05_03325, partial [Bifidobacteriaceae bacterium]|nr:hypothetical protein [Bifidobacteriaceae bacterium]